MFPPKILIIGQEAVRLRLPLMRRLRASGFEPIALGGALEEPEFVAERFRYLHYPIRRALNPFLDRAAQKKLDEIFARERPALVQAFQVKPTLLVPSVAVRHGIPCVRTITGLGTIMSSQSWTSLLLRPLYYYLQRKASRNALFTVFQNPDDREFFLKNRLAEAARTRLIRGSGIDVEGFQKEVNRVEEFRKEFQLEGKIVVTMVSRLLVPKGIREFLRAAETLAKKRTDCRFLLVGPSVEEGPGGLSARSLTGIKGITYLGMRQDIARILAASDLCVLPSYREGLPRVLMEGAALGLPLVTTDVPGCREVVRHGWNGLLVPVQDAAALASAIEALLDSSSLRAEMGKRSLLRAQEEFHIDRIADGYIELYRQILETATRSRAA